MSETEPQPAASDANTAPRPAPTTAASPRALWVALGVAVSFLPFGVRPWWVGLLGAFAVVAALRAWLGRSVRPIAFAVGLMLPAVLFGGLVVGIPAVRRYLHARSFDSAAWKRANDEKDTSSTGPRSTMIDDLRSSGILDGKTRADVEELLGPPLTRRTDEADRFRYLVGWTGGFMEIDPTILVIFFGLDDRVSRTALYN